MNFQDIKPIHPDESKLLGDIESDGYIDPNQPMQDEPVLLSSGQYFDHDVGKMLPIAIFTRQNYSCLVGLSKAKKSFLKSGIIARCIGGESHIYFPNMDSHFTGSGYIIDIDTEQSPWHAKRCFKRSIRMVGGMPSRYRSYCLRKYSPEQRLRFIHWLVTASPYRGQIDLISIDGYADLVYDFNSIEQSNRLQNYLTYWTHIGNLHITGILHQNFGTDKPVGHVGSATLKKAESVIFVRADDNGKGSVSVNNEYSRGIKFEPFRFNVNEKGIPHVIDEF